VQLTALAAVVLAVATLVWIHRAAKAKQVHV
jgi:hypothetical protein